MNKRIDESATLWFVYTKGMENGKKVKKVYKGECMGNRAVGRLQKVKLTQCMTFFLKERGLHEGQREWCMTRMFD